MKQNKILMAFLSVFLLNIATPSITFANNLPRHGYISNPPSRAYLCSKGNNTGCGVIIYEPQSVYGPKGFPENGPADGKIASGGIERFSQLDEQSPDRWRKINLKSGEKTFSWTLTAPHSTTSWQYYITKQNWDPNKPLERSDFDLKPFCEKFDNGKVPSDKVRMKCNIPDREGYQVILGVWTIANTGDAFYQVIDANISNTMFSEESDMQDEIYIDDITLSKIQKDNDDHMSYILELETDEEPASTPTFQWTLPKNAENIVEKSDFVSFDIKKSISLQEDKVRAKVTAGKSSKVLIQNIFVPGTEEVNYDYIFPEYIKFYGAGTRVYQPMNKHVYECKQFPYSGYCSQWGPGANQYEPGVGFAWDMAWILID